ncbi:hypothetical protein THERMOS_2050 [Bathymodiolus thermophilus thioautotrophic gill symbiont]|uniref:Uncharacterized protein n=1 Tax=Bathymodiolus thermophilus thioautotrophic gill symbiont TaxID=2360 RepID=A0A8H9CHM2_9GAMM|nr:hypothetical protein THERMOS_2050 [Bathymodiolus thermophilus thioautotrophic gill symbiont]
MPLPIQSMPLGLPNATGQHFSNLDSNHALKVSAFVSILRDC